ncbi:polymerase (RNA) III (DNA directed) polypeptide G like b [Notolabrus celidotus]|uniref:polymerase (RNA) III (DNA directed) polypeptide G like b n=1 Tax=Notolabrus celidotus TaxID=1203425 RepID=UPI0014902261|nr:polymerase (RNA) III (DNA directed) polypeptide G like b [Notolabrus celidotus]
MAGRGRGRGLRLMSFSVEAVGINRGDSLPPSIQQPTPVYPVMEQKPLPLTGGEEAEYLLALKQEFRGAMKSLPCFIQPAAAVRDVERYSDKYHQSEQTDPITEWTPDWKRFPKELRVRRPAPTGVSAGARSEKVQPSQKKKRVKEKEEVLLKLETLEKKEERGSEGEEEEEEGEQKKKQEEEEAEGEEEYDEEEFEEETDYVMSYFDNGEEFGGDSDENMDEAVY